MAHVHAALSNEELRARKEICHGLYIVQFFLAYIIALCNVPPPPPPLPPSLPPLQIKALVQCGRLKNAYLVAIRARMVDEVRNISEIAGKAGQLAVRDICDRWLETNSHGGGAGGGR